MTATVGVVSNGAVYIGSDSAGTAPGSGLQQSYAAQKAFRNGEFLFGTSGSYRRSQLLHYLFTPPAIEDDSDMLGYMVRHFIPAMKDLYSEHNEKLEEHILVGARGHLFRIEASFQVLETVDGFDAVGSGNFFALGAMSAHRHSQQDFPRTMIQAGLEAAAYFCASVREPFETVVLPPHDAGAQIAA